MKKILLIAVVLVVLPAMVFAASKTGQMQVNGVVLAAGECTIDNPGHVGFGNITPPISSNINITSNMGVTCPVDTPYIISLSVGGSGTYSQRQMSEAMTPSNKVNYNIYTDSTYTLVWGDGTGSSATVKGTGIGDFQQHDIWARMPSQATPVAGEYTDVLTVTLTY